MTSPPPEATEGRRAKRRHDPPWGRDGPVDPTSDLSADPGTKWDLSMTAPMLPGLR
jgi:hypothetical protein